MPVVVPRLQSNASDGRPIFSDGREIPVFNVVNSPDESLKNAEQREEEEEEQQQQQQKQQNHFVEARGMRAPGAASLPPSTALPPATGATRRTAKNPAVITPLSTTPSAHTHDIHAN